MGVLNNAVASSVLAKFNIRQITIAKLIKFKQSEAKERRPEIFGEREVQNSLSKFDDSSINIVPEIQAGDIEAFTKTNPSPIIVDIRTAQSFGMLSIPQSINMPPELFRKWIDGRSPFPAVCPVLLVCAVGEQSRYYAAYLRTLGCQSYNLAGGIMNWCDLREAA